MANITIATAVNASVDDVWGLFCKINRYPKWDAFVNEVMSASNPRLKAGSVYLERSGMQKSEWKVTVFDAPNRQVHVGRVGFMGEVTREFRVEPDGEGAVLRQTISFTIMPGFTRPFGWLAEELFVKRMVSKRLVQSGEGARGLLAGGE